MRCVRITQKWLFYVFFSPNKYTHTQYSTSHTQTAMPFFHAHFGNRKLWNFLKFQFLVLPIFFSPISHTSLFYQELWQSRFSLLHTHTFFVLSLTLSIVWCYDGKLNGKLQQQWWKKENSSLTSLRQHEWKEENKYYLYCCCCWVELIEKMWKKGTRRRQSSQCTLKQRDDGRRELVW